MIRFLFLVLSITLCLQLNVRWQDSLFYYEVEAQTIGTSNGVVPVWMRSNQFGSVPLSDVSASFIGRAYKAYDSKSAAIKLL